MKLLTHFSTSSRTPFAGARVSPPMVCLWGLTTFLLYTRKVATDASWSLPAEANDYSQVFLNVLECGGLAACAALAGVIFLITRDGRDLQKLWRGRMAILGLMLLVVGVFASMSNHSVAKGGLSLTDTPPHAAEPVLLFLREYCLWILFLAEVCLAGAIEIAAIWRKKDLEKEISVAKWLEDVEARKESDRLKAEITECDEKIEELDSKVGAWDARITEILSLKERFIENFLVDVADRRAQREATKREVARAKAVLDQHGDDNEGNPPPQSGGPVPFKKASGFGQVGHASVLLLLLSLACFGLTSCSDDERKASLDLEKTPIEIKAFVTPQLLSHEEQAKEFARFLSYEIPAGSTATIYDGSNGAKVATLTTRNIPALNDPSQRELREEEIFEDFQDFKNWLKQPANGRELNLVKCIETAAKLDLSEVDHVLFVGSPLLNPSEQKWSMRAGNLPTATALETGIAQSPIFGLSQNGLSLDGVSCHLVTLDEKQFESITHSRLVSSIWAHYTGLRNGVLRSFEADLRSVLPSLLEGHHDGVVSTELLKISPEKSIPIGSEDLVLSISEWMSKLAPKPKPVPTPEPVPEGGNKPSLLTETKVVREPLMLKEGITLKLEFVGTPENPSDLDLHFSRSGSVDDEISFQVSPKKRLLLRDTHGLTFTKIPVSKGRGVLNGYEVITVSGPIEIREDTFAWINLWRGAAPMAASLIIEVGGKTSSTTVKFDASLTGDYGVSRFDQRDDSAHWIKIPLLDILRRLESELTAR